MASLFGLEIDMPRGSECLFISYRRADTGTIGGRIFDRLSASLGARRIYMDIYANEPGDEFNDRIRHVLETARVFLPLLGPNWETITLPGAGHPRLWSPTDLVRQEIELALANGLNIIPILIDRKDPPEAEFLPESLHPLLQKHALSIRSDQTFHASLDALALAVDRFVFGDRGEISCALVVLESAEGIENIRRLIVDPVLAASGVSNVARLTVSRPEMMNLVMGADLVVLLGSILPPDITFLLGHRVAQGRKPAILVHPRDKPVHYAAGSRCVSCRVSDTGTARTELTRLIDGLF